MAILLLHEFDCSFLSRMVPHRIVMSTMIAPGARILVVHVLVSSACKRLVWAGPWRYLCGDRLAQPLS